MLDAVEGIKFGYILCGIIWAIACGFAVGNYACSLVHRLPRGRLLLDKKPYCGHCGAMLEVRDLFPVVSAVLLRHRCRYCSVPFPTSHTWTEIFVGVLFVLTFLKYGFGEQFLLIAAIGVFLITLAAIHANEGVVMGRIVLCVIVPAMLWRVMVDDSIYNFFQGGFWALIAGALIWRKDIKPAGHIYTLPKPVELFVVAGICVGESGLKEFVLYFAALYAFFWLVARLLRGGKPVPSTVPVGFAIMLPLLYPGALLALF